MNQAPSIQLEPQARRTGDYWLAVVVATEVIGINGRTWDIQVPDGFKTTEEAAIQAANAHADLLWQGGNIPRPF